MSLRSRIMVAGGGGGHYGYNPSTYHASAGGLTGYAGSYHYSCRAYSATGGTQTSGGTGYSQRGGFGYGGGNGAYSDGHVGRWWSEEATMAEEEQHGTLKEAEVHPSSQDIVAVTQ